MYMFDFFFKQKTAYEVRINDCSSDVCSSDLWADDVRFSRSASRVANRRILAECLQEALSSRSTTEWIEKFNAAKVSCGPINRMADIERDPQVNERNMIISDRKSAVEGKSVSVRVDLGGRRIIQKKKIIKKTQ